jgi:hypothetical protein
MKWILLISMAFLACSKQPVTENERMAKAVEESCRRSGGTTYLTGEPGNQVDAQLQQDLNQKLTPEQKERLLQLYQQYQSNSK